MDRIPLYLVALITAIAATPTKTAASLTNIYRVATWDLDVGSPRTFRARLVTAFRAVMSFVWPHRQRIALVAAMLVLLLVAPHHAAAGGSMIVMGHLAQLETDLKAKQAAAKDLLEKTMRACAETVVTPATATTAEVKGRLMTDQEKAAIQAILDDGKAIKARIDGATNDANMSAEIERLTAGMTSTTANNQTAQRVLKSMGQQLVEDPAFAAFIKAQGHRSSSAWLSPSVELHATTLDTTTGSGGQLIVSDYQPGITVPLLFKRLTVADLIAPGTTTSNSITYMRETTFTNAAAPVAQGAAKPESTLVFDQVSDLVQKLAHWLPITEEMLEDVATIQSYVDARLRLGVALTEEDQLLNGSGTAPAIRGILNRVGLTAAQARGADSNADAVFKQITTISSTIFVMPDGIVMNPSTWQTIQLTKNAAGNYLGSGPWANAQTPQLWGYPVAVTPSIVVNTALVGAFRQCAQVFRKGGVRVEASNSHMDFFVKNLVAIRAEERLALAVYRPAAFGTVTGLN
jgi:HK97 family phage major capsid protein